MTTISRRTILAAMAALPASAGLGHAIAAPDTPSGLQQLIDGHRAALAAADAAYETFRQLDQAYERTALLVPVAIDVDTWQALPAGTRRCGNPKGHVDLRLLGEVDVRADISRLHRDLLDGFIANPGDRPGYIEAAMEMLRRSEETALANLDRVVAEDRAAYEATGIPGAKAAVGRAEEAENDALEALLLHRPANVPEIATKALYLASIVDRGTIVGAVDAERARRFLESLAV